MSSAEECAMTNITSSSKKSHAVIMPILMVGLGALFYCYEYFLRISPSVMIPDLMRAYDLRGAEVGNLAAFYYHAYVPMQIAVGLLMDRIGPRRLLTVACILCATGTYLFAGHYGLISAELGRFIIGFGSAFAFVGALKLATIWLPPNRFALMSGLILCLGMIGAMIGDIVLQDLVQSIGWQITLYIAAVAGIVLALALWMFIRDVNPEHEEHLTHIIDFKTVLKGLWQAVINPQIWLNAFVGFLLYMSLSAFAELWGIPYLSQARGLSQENAVWVNSMIFLGWAVGGPFWGWFSDFIGRRCLPITVSAIGALIVSCILIYMPGLSEGWLYILLFLYGILSSVQILVFAICHEACRMRIPGTAIALTNMVVMIGGNVFQPVIGHLLDKNWTHTMLNGARVYPPHAYELALSVLPAGILLAIFITFFIKETYGNVHRVKC